MSTSNSKTFAPNTYPERAFDLHGLDGISDAQIQEHLALYAGYVKQVNVLNEEIATMVGHGQASGKNLEFAELTRRLGFEYNGMILHEHYFSGLHPAAEPTPPSGSALAAALIESFGSIEQWQAAFHVIGEMRGVGWVILFQDPATHWLTNHWITLHHEGVPAGFTPLLVMDVWEHAFMRDYKATERGKYIDAFYRNIDWSTIEQRLHETRRSASPAETPFPPAPGARGVPGAGQQVKGARAATRANESIPSPHHRGGTTPRGRSTRFP